VKEAQRQSSENKIAGSRGATQDALTTVEVQVWKPEVAGYFAESEPGAQVE
jgi:hypothetical protein